MPAYVVLIDTPEQLALVHAIRIEVFVEEQGFDILHEMDEKDSTSDHFLLYDSENDTKPIGTVRYYPLLSKLGRLAIVRSARGKGYGYVLVKAMEDHVVAGRGKAGIYQKENELKSVTIVAVSQEHAQPFYSKCGYVAEGPVFDEDLQPHRKMTKVVKLA